MRLVICLKKGTEARRHAGTKGVLRLAGADIGVLPAALRGVRRARTDAAEAAEQCRGLLRAPTVREGLASSVARFSGAGRGKEAERRRDEGGRGEMARWGDGEVAVGFRVALREKARLPPARHPAARRPGQSPGRPSTPESTRTASSMRAMRVAKARAVGVRPYDAADAFLYSCSGYLARYAARKSSTAAASASRPGPVAAARTAWSSMPRTSGINF